MIAMTTNPNYISSRINPLARPALDALATRLPKMPVCPECSRRFDLFDSTDYDEWFNGHDCEVEG